LDLQDAILRLYPHPQVIDGVADDVGALVTGELEKGVIHVHVAAFLSGADRDRERAALKGLGEPFLGVT
jgi:hypothetical protein